MKDKKCHIEASKLSTDLSFLLAFGFVVFCCYEMHSLQDSPPIAYLGAGVLVFLGLVVNAYMKRAAAKDLANQKIYETKITSELKKEYGDDFHEGEVHDVDIRV